jgi:hypothetical protein
MIFTIRMILFMAQAIVDFAAALFVSSLLPQPGSTRIRTCRRSWQRISSGQISGGHKDTAHP